MSTLIIILICYHSILNWVDTSINEGEVRNSIYVDKDKEYDYFVIKLPKEV